MYARLIINYRHHIKKDRLKRFSDFQTTFYQMMWNINFLTSFVPHQVLGRLRLVSFVYFYNCRNFQ